MKDARLQMVRKLAHDVNGPLGNSTAFIDLALQQFSELANKLENSDDVETLAGLNMGIEFLRLSVPSIVQLQRNMRMWSALHQIVVEEYGVQLRKLSVLEYIDSAYEQLAIFLRKKGISYRVEGALTNRLIADAELFGLITFHFFDLAIAVGSRNNEVVFTLSEDVSQDEITIRVSLVLDGNHPNLNEQLASRFSTNIDNLPEAFPQGILKPLAYGSIFVPTAVEAMGGTFDFTLDNEFLTCDMHFKANKQ